jgi:hypothetical protein
VERNAETGEKGLERKERLEVESWLKVEKKTESRYKGLKWTKRFKEGRKAKRGEKG